MPDPNPNLPRVALLMNGLPRFGADTDTLVQRLTGYSQIDWYVSFWTHRPDALSDFDSRWQELSDIQLRDTIESRLPLDQTVAYCEWVDPLDLAPIPQDYPEFYSNPKNTWQQYQLLQWNNRVRRAYEANQRVKYDLIIRGRADCGMSHTLDLQEIYDYLVTKNPLGLIIPNNQRQGPYQFCDHMAIGLPGAIDCLANVVDSFDSAFRQGIPYNAEIMIGSLLTKMGLNWPATNWESTLKSQGYYDANGVFHQDPGRWGF